MAGEGSRWQRKGKKGRKPGEVQYPSSGSMDKDLRGGSRISHVFFRKEMTL